MKRSDEHSEIGIRMALGARRSDVLRLVMRQTVVVVTIGAGIGVALALAASRLIGSLLFGIAPSDPFAIGVSARRSDRSRVGCLISARTSGGAARSDAGAQI